jgi:formylglycine-generating enzyme required for sulfatase activity
VIVRPEGVPISEEQVASGVVSGFKIGVLRQRYSLGAFEIARHPVTVGEFRACVDAGACSRPTADGCATRSRNPLDGPNFSEGADNSPATCVGVRQSEQYCEWVGGMLPSLEEWLFAARGHEPQRFPWGATEANCDQHALGEPPVSDADTPDLSHLDLSGLSPEEVREQVRLELERTNQPCRQEGEEPAVRFAVGRYPAGASPSGVQDILLAPGELLRLTEKSLFAPCQKGGGAAGCLVYGLTPGAIDAVQRVEQAAQRKPEQAQRAYGFRCAWEG